MNTYVTEKERKTPIIENYDVVVVGGGIAGVAAALSAARNGARTCIIENEACLGGLATLGLINKYLPLCDGMGNQLVGGIGEELIKNSIKYGPGEIPSCWQKDGDKEKRKEVRYKLTFNIASFIISMEELLIDAGVTLIYNCRFCDVVREDNKITSVIVENKSGRCAIACDAVIDASGDADVCDRAGEPTIVCDKNRPDVWFFSYDGGNIDWHVLINAKDKNPIQHLYNGVDWRDVSRLLIDTRKKIIDKVKAVNSTDERKIYPLLIPALPEFRTTRRLSGKFELDGSHDKIYFEDCVGMTGDWRKRGPVYYIPLSSLTGVRNSNLITAGRCISNTDSGWEITRVIPACAVTGEAAGAAAAMLIKGGFGSFDELNVKKLQEMLISQGVIIDKSFAVNI